MRIERYRKTRYWAVLDAACTLVCLCVYRKGAEEVVKRLLERDNSQQWQDVNSSNEDMADAVVDCKVFKLQPEAVSA